MKPNEKKMALNFFKRMSISILLLLTLVISIGFSVTSEKLSPENQHPMVGQVLSKLFPRYHYAHKKLDNKMSAKHLELYIEMLDPNRNYFLASDIKQFSRFRHELDDAIKSGELEPAFYVFNIFKQRVQERVKNVTRQFEQGFDFALKESFQPDRRNAPWPKNEAELNEVWRKRLKNEALEQKFRKKDKAATDSILTRRYNNFERRINEYEAEDVFQIFATSLTRSYDPHSAYLSPITSDNFGIEMTLSFQGIGASLVQEDLYTKVHSIIPGGPADRGKQLKANDKIIGVAQGIDSAMLDVIGMRLDDVVQKIRGKKGTVVRLQLIPADAVSNDQTKVISIVRDKVVLKDREAKSDTVKLEHEGTEYTIGVISIPTFYADYADRRLHPSTYKTTTRDVKRLIHELKGAAIDGLIIDLRNNGGGFLTEAINLTGLFIEKGPVVQVKMTDGDVDIERDTDASIVYDGPLAVLVNRLSASASEIFAAAIQDYDRGIVLGTQTFGKGTVQRLLDLNRFITRSEKKLGKLKITTSKFYRIAGGTTQHQGVIPDIIFPSVQSEMEIGENTEKNALAWDQIQAVNFEHLYRATPFLNKLTKKSWHRTKANPEFNYINEDIETYKQRKKRNSISLNQIIRKEEREKQEEKSLARKNQRRLAKGLKPLKKDEKDEKDENQVTRPDAILLETEKVLADLIYLSSSAQSKSVAKDLR